jgi:hypothetical protein
MHALAAVPLRCTGPPCLIHVEGRAGRRAASRHKPWKAAPLDEHMAWPAHAPTCTLRVPALPWARCGVPAALASCMNGGRVSCWPKWHHMPPPCSQRNRGTAASVRPLRLTSPRGQPTGAINLSLRAASALITGYTKARAAKQLAEAVPASLPVSHEAKLYTHSSSVGNRQHLISCSSARLQRNRCCRAQPSSGTCRRGRTGPTRGRPPTRPWNEAGRPARRRQALGTPRPWPPAAGRACVPARAGQRGRHQRHPLRSWASARLCGRAAQAGGALPPSSHALPRSTQQKQPISVQGCRGSLRATAQRLCNSQSPSRSALPPAGCAFMRRHTVLPPCSRATAAPGAHLLAQNHVPRLHHVCKARGRAGLD